MLLHNSTVLEELQVIDQKSGCAADGVFRIDAAVSPYFQSQFIVIGHVADTGIGHAKFNAGDRRINAVNGNPADAHIISLILVTGYISPAGIDINIDFQAGVFVQRCDMQIRIQDLHVAVGFNVFSRNFLFACSVDMQNLHLAVRRT